MQLVADTLWIGLRYIVVEILRRLLTVLSHRICHFSTDCISSLCHYISLLFSYTVYEFEKSFITVSLQCHPISDFQFPVRQ